MHLNTGLPEKDFYKSFINSIAIDSSGNKWIGKNGSGLSKFDGRIWINYYQSNSGLPSDNVTSIVIDSTGNIWIGTTGS
jgi:ligand-binding sensor domain-containing protein